MNSYKITRNVAKYGFILNPKPATNTTPGTIKNEINVVMKNAFNCGTNSVIFEIVISAPTSINLADILSAFLKYIMNNLDQHEVQLYECVDLLYRLRLKYHNKLLMENSDQ